MSDDELEAIRRKKLLALQKKLTKTPETIGEIDTNKVLDGIFKGRAWEVFNYATFQFPNVMSKVKEGLVELATSGRLKQVNGEQLFSFLRKMGLRVRLNTKISFTEHGRLKSLEDKLKEDLSS